MMIFVIKFEKYVADAGILGVIIGKLHHRKKPYPIILLKVDKSLEVGLHYTILSFGLIVCLWVKSSRESPFDTKEIA